MDKWIPIERKLPPVDKDGFSKWVLASFENYHTPDMGLYIVDDDGNGAFHPEEFDRSYASYDLFVNAWMPLPEPYRESEHEPQPIQTDCAWMEGGEEEW